MKRYIFIFVVLMLTMITACTPSTGDTVSGEQATVTVSKEQASSQPEESEPAATPPEADVPEPSKITADQNIPDIAIDAAEKSNSNYTLYEDADNIYYLWRNDIHEGDLLIIDKNSGNITKIKDKCYSFAFNNGKIYYENTYQEGDAENIVIEEYDVKTGDTDALINLKYGLSVIACYSERLYFTMYANNGEEEEPYEDLYFADINGSNKKRLQENVGSFCIYDGRIFCTTSKGADGGSLFEYKKNRELSEQDFGPSVDWYFDISHGKAICMELIGDNLIYDIDSGEQKDLFRDYGTIAGQYIISYEYDNKGVPKLLKAYDFLQDKEYVLLDLSDIVNVPASVEVNATKDNIYLCIETRHPDELKMYRIIIRNGEAVVEYVATVTKNE